MIQLRSIGKAVISLILLICLSLGIGRGQFRPTDYYDNTGQPMFSFQTYDQCLAGQSRSNALYIKFGNPVTGENHANGYHVSVVANSDFTNGGFSIPASKVSLHLNSCSDGPTPTGSEVYLSTSSEQVVANATGALTTPPVSYFAQGYDVKVLGGTWLMVPPGTYSASFTFNMYDNQTGNLMGSLSNVNLQIQVTYDNSCGGLALGGWFTNGPNVATYDMIASGATSSGAFTVSYNPGSTACRGWTLKVHTTGNFQNTDNNPNHYISASNVLIAFNQVTQGAPTAAAIGVSNASIPLSTADVNVISNAQAGFSGYTAHSFNMTVQGGNYLLAIGTGTFATSLVFGLYNQAGSLVSTFSLPVTLTVSFSNSNSATITLTDPDVLFQFSSLADYTNGKTVTKTNGLEILAYHGHQLNAEVTYPNFTSGSNTLTPSVLQLAVVPNHTYVPDWTPSSITPVPTGIYGYTINMSYGWQKVLDNPVPEDNGYPYQDAFYDLIYTIQGGNSDLYAAPAGTYTNQVIFQLVPY